MCKMQYKRKGKGFQDDIRDRTVKDADITVCSDRN